MDLLFVWVTTMPLPFESFLIPNAILSHQHALVLLLNSLLGMSKEQDCPPKPTMMKLGKVEDKVKPKNK